MVAIDARSSLGNTKLDIESIIATDLTDGILA